MVRVLMYGISSDVKKITPQYALESIEFEPEVFEDILGDKARSVSYNGRIYLRGLNTNNRSFHKYMTNLKRGDVVASFSENRIMSVGVIGEIMNDPRFSDKMQHNNYTRKHGRASPSKQKQAARYEGVLFLKDLRVTDFPVPALKQKLGLASKEAWRGGKMFVLPDQVAVILDYLGHGSESEDERSLLDDLAAIEQSDMKPTEKDRFTKARLGQGQYREDLLEYWDNACALTGIRMPEILVASHIKPWKASIGAKEKLSKYNGLLLLPTIDKAFDRGFITFDDDGFIKISADFGVASKLGLEKGQRLIKLEDRHKEYLAYHRQHVFEKWRTK